MKRSEFHISKMDCPSEERLIRMALEGKIQFAALEFDLAGRNLAVIHEGEASNILATLMPLKLGVELIKTSAIDSDTAPISTIGSDTSELAVLKKVFAINATMFVVGLIGGLIAQSTGLISDSLDMFADAAVFALSIYAVGKTIDKKKQAARFSGYLQLALALFAFGEVVRRVLYGSEPRASYMMILAGVALIANATSMVLLAKHKDKEVHMKASWIFLSNDVIANAGVIVAGLLVNVFHSHIPDLAIGMLIAFVVFFGSIRILKAAK